jgi:hypothetical protein
MAAPGIRIDQDQNGPQPLIALTRPAMDEILIWLD